MSKISKKHLNQSGMVSFTVTLIMMIVITLIVIGFSQVVRRNQREALDRQLSAQAFYAAESGINATRDAITNYVAANPTATLTAKTSCQNDYDPSKSGGLGSAIQNLSTSPSVQYTCVLVDPNPTSVVRRAGANESIVTPLRSQLPLTSLSFAWPKQSGATDSSCSAANPNVLPTQNDWKCGNALLRVELVRTPTGSALSSADFSDTRIFYLSPYGSGSSAAATSQVNFGSAGSSCTTGSGVCKATINLAGSGFNSTSYYARITPLYRSANDDPGITITGTVAGGAATFNGSQAIVDVTGRAQDELRRIQARVSLTPTTDASPFAALSSSVDICKQFTIYPTSNITLNQVCGVIASGVTPEVAFTSGCVGNCSTGPSGGGGTYFTRQFTNQSSYRGQTATSCTWHWDDGSADDHTACNVGDTIKHTFPNTPPGTCKTYNVSLTVNFGSSYTSTSNSYVEPHGASSGC